MASKNKKSWKQAELLPHAPLWELNIKEVEGHNIEEKGREVVNKMLKDGWILLHVYTLKYELNGVWQERPMAILGRPGKK